MRLILGVLLLLDAVMNSTIVLGEEFPGWFAMVTKVCEVRRDATMLKDTSKELKVSVPPAGYAGGYHDFFFSVSFKDGLDIFMGVRLTSFQRSSIKFLVCLPTPCRFLGAESCLFVKMNITIVLGEGLYA